MPVLRLDLRCLKEVVIYHEASRFRRYLNRKRENRKWLNKAIDEGPYEFKEFTPSKTEPPRMQKEKDLKRDDLKHYEAEIVAMNLILISIPNDIYNSVDTCTTAQAMWQRVERLMRGTVQNKVNRKTRFNNEFDQFVAEPGEALVLVYNRFAQLMNNFERNGIKFPPVTVNTKTTSPYYVTHPSSVVDYDEDYQGDAVQNTSEDPLTSAMILLARVITQRFSNPTNNRLRTSSITRNQAIVQADRGTNVQNDAGNIQRNLRTTSSGTVANNDFLFVDASWMEEIKELSANICLMARIQPANFDSDAGPSYDFAFLSEDQAMILHFSVRYKLHPPVIRIHYLLKITKNKNVNSGSVEYDNNVEESYKIEQLARNAYMEAEKQQIIAKKDVETTNTNCDTRLTRFAQRRAKNSLVSGVSQESDLIILEEKAQFSQNPKLYDASCLDDLKI
ncbi:hypothetical protein Tco_1522917 [Tanacetum coccineum]